MRRHARYASSPWASYGLLTLNVCVAFCFGLAPAAAGPEAPGPGAARILPAPSSQVQFGKRTRIDLGHLPLYFVENRGQLAGRVKFYQTGQGQALYFTREGIDFALQPGTAAAPGPVPHYRGKWANRPVLKNRYGLAPREVTKFRLTPVGLSSRAKVVALEPQTGRVHYYWGNDPNRWQTGLPTYRAVAYEGAYLGIDLKFHGTGRQMEYDVIVQSGADPRQVKFHYEGIKGLEITQAGDLLIKLPDGGSLVQKKPFAYQQINGIRVARESKFKLVQGKEGVSQSFEVASYDKRFPLVIDPVLVYSAYLGGSDYDVGNAIAVDGDGYIYIAGTTCSQDFLLGLEGTSEAFVVKLDQNGQYYYTAYLGRGGLLSNESAEGYGIAVDGLGNAYVTGYTDSSHFPTLNAFQTALNGSSDAFVVKLDPLGNVLYSSYLGNSSDDAGYAIAVDVKGNAYVTGETYNSNNYDAFAAKISQDSSTGATLLVYYKTLGGSYDDAGYAIAVDKSGNAYVAGETQSPDFYVNGLQTFKGVSDAFVAKLDLDGNLIYSTFLGGSGMDAAYGIAVDQNGNIYVAGETYSADFPLKNPCKSTKKGDSDAFVAKIDASGTALSYSTFLGQPYDAAAYGLALDTAGNAYLTGLTSLPAAGSDPPVFYADAFVARLNPFGRNLGFFRFGGSDDDWGNGIALDNAGNMYVTGQTWSNDFPAVPIGWLNGNADAFITEIQPPLPGNSIAPILELLLLGH
jgi:hypothetical protein